jgi:signal transduction histidine kinase
LTQVFFDHFVVLSYLRYMSYFLFMAGLWAFISYTPWIGLKPVSRCMWRLHLVCAIGAIVFDILMPMSLEVIFDVSFISVAVAILVVGFEMIRAARREPREAKIFGIGFGIFAITSLCDILTGLQILKLPRVIFPWGQLVFLLSLAYLFILRYQSEMMALQAEALRSAHLASLGELAAGVAHEINNPISGIIGYAEILVQICNKQGIESEIPARIIKEGHRIATITGNLLSFSQNRKQLLKPIRMQAVIADALALEAKLFQRRHIKIMLDIPEALPLVKADRHQIQQVLINLLNNARYALEHTNNDQHEEKYVEIQCTVVAIQDRQYVRTNVFDNGPGIPENMLDKICNPFYTSKPRGEGTGLGLSISYGIIEAHKGRLSFESEEGSHTKAIIDLPVIV